MQSYSNTEVIKLNEENLDYSLFENSKSSNLPVLENGKVTPTYNALYALAH